MKKSMAMKRIVALGGGYAGIRALLDLQEARRWRGLRAELTLIDRGTGHQVVTLLHRVATEDLPPASALLPFRRLLPDVEILQAEVSEIDLDRRRVITDRGEIAYDRLVIGLGSETASPPIPGLEEHALNLRWWGDAVRLRRRVRELFARAAGAGSASERRGLLRLVVAGGGATGCQLAGEICHWVTDLADEFAVPVGEIEILLLDAQPTLLTGLERGAARRAERVLRRKAISVNLESPLESVAVGEVAFGGETLPCGAVFWTGGVRAPELLAACGLETGDAGRVKVDRALRCVGRPAVLVAGDCALVEVGGRPVPATAAFALRQGAYVAQALESERKGRRIAPYKPRDLGMLVSLGGADAVGDLLGFPLTGLAAGLAKEGIERSYVATVLGQLPPLPI